MVLKGKWTLIKYIAAGACAEVWEVECDDKTAAQEGSRSWVAKIVANPPEMSAAERKKKRKKATDEELFARTLSWEHTLYSGLLRGHSSIPKLPVRDNYGCEQGICFVIMERLGATLSQAFTDAGKRWPNVVLASRGRQMLQCLRECHDRKILYIDVKPENFMLVKLTFFPVAVAFKWITPL
jgi:serine/threonine protein kinase